MEGMEIQPSHTPEELLAALDALPDHPDDVLTDNWISWQRQNPMPPQGPSHGDAFEGGYLAGLLRAQNLIEEKFFGGPTRDMIVGWIATEIASFDVSEAK